jgi:hypothetical protein
VRMVRSRFRFRSFLLPLIALLLLGQDLPTLPEGTKKPAIFFKKLHLRINKSTLTYDRYENNSPNWNDVRLRLSWLGCLRS